MELVNSILEVTEAMESIAEFHEFVKKVLPKT